jgi:predicted nucleic acid-binding protein
LKRFLLDTNVISEPMRPRPSVAVLRWFEARDPAQLFLSAITLGELVAGIRRLASAARRRALEQWLADVVVRQFEGRVLPFDAEVAWRWGALIAEAANTGRPRPAIDLQIAAIAAHHGLVLVSRNAADFSGLGLDVVNPWDIA